METPDFLPPSQASPDMEMEARKKSHREFRKRIEASKTYRRKLSPGWQTNVDYRRGKPFASQSDEDRVAVPLDYTLTEMKISLLFSQVPALYVNHPPDTIGDQSAAWVHKFQKRVNDVLVESGIETAMDECLPDCINAAGFGVIMVSYEAITEDVEVPSMDLSLFPPELQSQILQSGMMPWGDPVPMTTVPRILDKRYVIERISPSDFLWPVSFSGSDFDKSPWIGRTGQVTWAVAKQRWGLDERQKNKHLGIEKHPQDTISSDVDRDTEQTGDEWVAFDEIFYKTNQYDATAKNYTQIHHLVFVTGKDEPVIDEPWKGQEIDEESGAVIGSQRYPIRVLTLTYFSDEAIPPSDTAMGRPQVNEINKARTQMILQRQHSIPIRTFDVNRVDTTIQFSLMKGTWQGMIPVQGNGQSIISEVTRSAFPPENYKFDEIAKSDLFEIWMVGQEFGGTNVETKGEADQIAGNTNVRIGRARAKVGKFFCSISEVLGGLIAIYEDPGSFGEGFVPTVSRTLGYSILADSTVLLDSNQRLQRLERFINFTAKSGVVNVPPVLKEIATLSGLDPSVVIVPPTPRPPVEPNISLRLTGTEDMLNPITLAFLINSGQAPTPEQIEQAKKMIQVAVTPPAGVIPGPMGELAMAPDPSQVPTPEDVGPLPQPAPPDVGKANPNWSALDRVNQRVLDRKGEQ